MPALWEVWLLVEPEEVAGVDADPALLLLPELEEELDSEEELVEFWEGKEVPVPPSIVKAPVKAISGERPNSKASTIKSFMNKNLSIWQFITYSHHLKEGPWESSKHTSNHQHSLL